MDCLSSNFYCSTEWKLSTFGRLYIDASTSPIICCILVIVSLQFKVEKQSKYSSILLLSALFESAFRNGEFFKIGVVRYWLLKFTMQTEMLRQCFQ